MDYCYYYDLCNGVFHPCNSLYTVSNLLTRVQKMERQNDRGEAASYYYAFNIFFLSNLPFFSVHPARITAYANLNPPCLRNKTVRISMLQEHAGGTINSPGYKLVIFFATFLHLCFCFLLFPCYLATILQCGINQDYCLSFIPPSCQALCESFLGLPWIVLTRNHSYPHASSC